MDDKQIEMGINKLYIKWAAKSRHSLPEGLYEDLFEIIKQAETKGWNDCYKTCLEDDSIDP